MTKTGRKRRSGSSYAHIGSTVSAQWIPQVAAYKCNFPWDKAKTPMLVELIKTKVPSAYRTYDHTTYTWYLAEEYFDALLPIIRGIFPNCTFNIMSKAKVDEYSHGMASSQVVSTDKLAEEFYLLLERAGLQPNREKLEVSIIKRDYLRAARHYHPDLNPQFAGEMSRLNELWANLKGVYFK